MYEYAKQRTIRHSYKSTQSATSRKHLYMSNFFEPSPRSDPTLVRTLGLRKGVMSWNVTTRLYRICATRRYILHFRDYHLTFRLCKRLHTRFNAILTHLHSRLDPGSKDYTSPLHCPALSAAYSDVQKKHISISEQYLLCS